MCKSHILLNKNMVDPFGDQFLWSNYYIHQGEHLVFPIVVSFSILEFSDLSIFIVL